MLASCKQLQAIDSDYFGISLKSRSIVLLFTAEPVVWRRRRVEIRNERPEAIRDEI